jgi:hypothetical protein
MACGHCYHEICIVTYAESRGQTLNSVLCPVCKKSREDLATASDSLMTGGSGGPGNALSSGSGSGGPGNDGPIYMVADETDDGTTDDGKGKGKGNTKGNTKGKSNTKGKGSTKGKGKGKGNTKGKGKAQVAPLMMAVTAADDGDVTPDVGAAIGDGDVTPEVGAAAEDGEVTDDGGNSLLTAIFGDAGDGVGTAKAKAKATVKAKAKPKSKGKAKAKATVKAKAKATVKAKAKSKGSGKGTAAAVAEPVPEPEVEAVADVAPPAEAVPAVVAPVEAIVPLAPNPNFSEDVLCHSCGRHESFRKCRLLAKKAGGKWQCSGCGCKAVMLRRKFGEWPVEAFSRLTPDCIE